MCAAVEGSGSGGGGGGHEPHGSGGGGGGGGGNHNNRAHERVALGLAPEARAEFQRSSRRTRRLYRSG